MPRGRKMTESGRIKLGKRVDLNKRIMDSLEKGITQWASKHRKPHDKALAIWTCLMDNGLDIYIKKGKAPWQK